MKDVPGGYTRVNRYVRWMMHKITDITPKVSVCNGTFGTWIGKRVGWEPNFFIPFLFTLFFVDTHALNKNKEHFLQVLHFSQSSDGWSDWGCSGGWIGPSTSGDGDTAIFDVTFPDANSWALHVFLQMRNSRSLNFISGKRPRKIFWFINGKQYYNRKST